MRKFIKILLLSGFILLFPVGLVLAATNYDGNYSVDQSTYTQTCEPPIDLQSGFTVTNNKFVNLWGQDGEIAADGSGSMQMNYGSNEYVKLTYQFSESNGKLRADVTWTSTSNSPEFHPNGCSGSFTANSSSFNFNFDFGNLGGTAEIIIICAIGGICIVGVIIFIFIYRVIVVEPPRRGPAVPPVPAQPPVPVQPPAPPLAPVQLPGPRQPIGSPTANQTGPTATKVGTPKTETKPNNGPRKFRPVYGKKHPTKKGVRIWQERTKRK